MKTLSAFVLFLGFLLSGCGKVHVYGCIVDETGSVISNATISSEKEAITIATDDRGHFLLKDIGTNDSLIISAPGYEPVKCGVLHRTPWLETVLKRENVLGANALQANPAQNASIPRPDQ